MRSSVSFWGIARCITYWNNRNWLTTVGWHASWQTQKQTTRWWLRTVHRHHCAFPRWSFKGRLMTACAARVFSQDERLASSTYSSFLHLGIWSWFWAKENALFKCLEEMTSFLLILPIMWVIQHSSQHPFLTLIWLLSLRVGLQQLCTFWMWYLVQIQ